MFPFNHFPELPSAKTLLVTGDYHPSAPVHFCISHLSNDNDRGDEGVFITPSKQAFVQILVEYNDRWLGKYGGSGQVATKLTRVKAFYPSTVDQLTVLLSLLHWPSSTTPELNPKLVLSTPPKFIILHEVSSLFVDPELEATCPDYLRVIAQATDLTSSLSGTAERSVNLVWFDSQAHNLMLPALPRPTYVNDAEKKYYEPISVGKMAEKYFEWVGNVSVGKRMVQGWEMFVLNREPIVGGESLLKVSLCGPANTEISWEWGERETVPEMCA